MDIKNQSLCLKTEFKPYECLYWLMMFLSPIIIACASIAIISYYWMFIYVAVFLAMQIVVMRFLCVHCPHYCKEKKLLRCMFLWNAPKIFKPRPGAWKRVDKIMLAIAMVAIFFFPVYWVWQNKLLFTLYIITGLNFAFTMKKYECSRCVYFHCPNNCVSEETKKIFNNQKIKNK